MLLRSAAPAVRGSDRGSARAGAPAGRAGYLHLALRRRGGGQGLRGAGGGPSGRALGPLRSRRVPAAQRQRGGLAELRRELELKPDNVDGPPRDRLRADRARRLRGGARPPPSARRSWLPASSPPATPRAACSSSWASSTPGSWSSRRRSRLAPDSPEMHFSLARAYSEGRPRTEEDGRASVTELDRAAGPPAAERRAAQRRAAAGGGAAVRPRTARARVRDGSRPAGVGEPATRARPPPAGGAGRVFRDRVRSSDAGRGGARQEGPHGARPAAGGARRARGRRPAGGRCPSGCARRASRAKTAVGSQAADAGGGGSARLGARHGPRHVNLVTLVFDQLGRGRAARSRARPAGPRGPRRPAPNSSCPCSRSGRACGSSSSSRRPRARAKPSWRRPVRPPPSYANATEQLDEAVARQAEGPRSAANPRLRRHGGGQASTPGRARPRRGRGAHGGGRAAHDRDAAAGAAGPVLALFAILALARSSSAWRGARRSCSSRRACRCRRRSSTCFRAAVSEANRANVSVYAVDVRGLAARAPTWRPPARCSSRRPPPQQRQMHEPRRRPVPKEQMLALDDRARRAADGPQGTLQRPRRGHGRSCSSPTATTCARASRGRWATCAATTSWSTSRRRKEYDGRFRRDRGEGHAARRARPGAQRLLRAAAGGGQRELPLRGGAAAGPAQPPAARRLPGPRHGLSVRARARRRALHGSARGAARRDSLEAEDRGETDRAHFSMMVVVRDPSGAVVEKFSEDSPVFLPRTRREALKQGNAVFMRSFRSRPAVTPSKRRSWTSSRAATGASARCWRWPEGRQGSR